jgi:hypothetical protein
MHMNVVFDQRGPDDNKIVTCMERAFPDPGSDGNEQGGFVDVQVFTFLNVGPIVIACASCGGSKIAGRSREAGAASQGGSPQRS